MEGDTTFKGEISIGIGSRHPSRLIGRQFGSTDRISRFAQHDEASAIKTLGFSTVCMNNGEPALVNFTISRPDPNIIALVFPNLIIIINVVTNQALIVPEGPFYQATVDELWLGD